MYDECRHTQHGELTDYSLPPGGSGFAASVHLDHDAVGNLKTLQRDGATLVGLTAPSPPPAPNPL